jgi:hypothetical protein
MVDPLIAAKHWPDPFDSTITIVFAVALLMTVSLGYVFMVLDYRAYLRSLRRALVRVANYLPYVPEWAVVETPRCLSSMGLRMPCTQEDLLRAYRERVKELHPDRGGDRRRFLALQNNFEEAAAFLAERDRKSVG